MSYSWAICFPKTGILPNPKKISKVSDWPIPKSVKEVHQESFDRLKESLISSPILTYPNYNKPFILETDTSLKGLGTVLSQEDDDGNFCIISYASHMLKLSERSMCNYSCLRLSGLCAKNSGII